VRSVAFAILLMLAGARAARAQEGPNGGNVLAITGGVIAGVVGSFITIGGLVSLAGGSNDLAHDRSTRSWRVANYVFGTCNLVSGIVLGSVAVGVGDDTFLHAGGAGALTLFALAAANISVAVVSAKRAGRAKPSAAGLSWSF
jgi:hypothetical protein